MWEEIGEGRVGMMGWSGVHQKRGSSVSLLWTGSVSSLEEQLLCGSGKVFQLNFPLIINNTSFSILFLYKKLGSLTHNTLTHI